MPSVLKLGKITHIGTPKFVERSIMEYGREVLEDRAIPVDLDGFKPSQRRILFALSELGSKPSGNYMKCARVVGEAMGKYHPHGDASLYETLVNMTAIFKARYPMIEGHGNFGSAVGDPAAASRYTECRITKLGVEVVDDLAVMPTVPNYSNDYMEPLVMPARVPLLLCNGSQGIAVGVSDNIPPHNLAEVIDATIRLVKKPNTRAKKLLKYIQGPDYANGAVLTSPPSELKALYTTGKGGLSFRCDYKIEDAKDHKMLVITSLAPNFNITGFFNKCQKLQDDGAIEYANDETDHKNGVRLVVGFKSPQAMNDIIIPMLSTRVSYDFYAIEQLWMKEGGTLGVESDGGTKKFRHYTLPSLLTSWITQRRYIEKLLLLAEQKKVTDDIELAEARLIATQKLDAVIKILRDRKNTNREMVVAKLIKGIGYTERQANYICDLKLIQVSNFTEADQVEAIKKLKARLKEILTDLKDLNGVLIRRLKDMKSKYKDDRKTRVESGKGKVSKLRMKVKSKYLMVSPDAGYRSFDDAPVKKGDYPKRSSAGPDSVMITRGGESATVVWADGLAQEIPVGYTKDGFLSRDKSDMDGGNEVVGIVSEQDKVLVAVSEDGEVCPIESKQGKTEYVVGKFSSPLKAVVGVNDDDKFLLVAKNAAYWCYGKDLPLRRKNTKGKHLGGLRTCVHAFAIKEDTFLYDDHGQPFEPLKKGKAGEAFEMKAPKRIYVVGKGDNLVVYKDGSPGRLTKQETVVALRNKEIARVWPVE